MSNLEKGETPITPIRERDSDTTTIQQIFDQGKSGLLDDIRLLLRSVSEMELATDDFDEDLSFYDLPIIARRIVRRLERIEHLNCIVS